jgi:hypothetical protein
VALTDLAAISKLKLRQALSPATQASPAKVVPRPSLAPTSNQILNSPMPIRRQTRSQTTIHTQNIPNVPLPPRVVTPRALRQSPPMVPTGSQRLDKLLPLPHPPVRARTDAWTNPSAQRATQLKSVLARVYAASIQNQITTTVP